MAQRVEITNEELNALTSAIKTRYGLDFTEYEVKSLKRGFTRLMMKRNISSLLEMWKHVLQDREFIFSCIDDLTVNLTELFRNPEFWVYMQQDLLPQFGAKELKILHAGCSTGEEVYSMRIAASMSALPTPIQTATDLNIKVLEQARSGSFANVLLEKYKAKFEQAYPNTPFDRFFDFGKDRFEVKSHLKRKMDFYQHNLVHDSIPDTYDIIFCRNVLIYFDDTLKLKVLEQFQKSLARGGYLIMGYYDVMPNGYENYFHVHHSRCRVYKLSNHETKPLFNKSHEQPKAYSI